MTGYTSTKIIGTHRVSKLATDQVQLNQMIGTNWVHLYQDERYNITSDQVQFTKRYYRVHLIKMKGTHLQKIIVTDQVQFLEMWASASCALLWEHWVPGTTCDKMIIIIITIGVLIITIITVAIIGWVPRIAVKNGFCV